MSEPVPVPAPLPQEAQPEGRVAVMADRLENGLLLAILAALICLPLLEMAGRMVQENLHMELFLRVPNSAAYLRASVLWLTFVGAVIATRERGHIGLSLAEMVAKGNLRRWLHFFAYAVAAAVASLLAFASYQVAVLDKGQGTPLFVFVPVWVEECVMPAALTIVALLFVWQSGGAGEEPGKRREAMFLRLVALLAIPFAFWLLPPAPPPHWLANLGYGPCPWTASLAWPLVIVILAATMSGAPVFVAMTGIAIIFFFREGTPIHAVTDEVFGLLGSPTLPAIPLLTGAGYLLAESKAGTRLVRVLRALLGSFRGGVAISMLVLLALFTAFTGGSGVTILALGGLAAGILKEDGQPEGFSLGLVTTSGSLGLLFFPSIPVLLYSVVASVPADLLYIAGALPGIVMILVVGAYTLWKARAAFKTSGVALQPFSLKELALAFRGAVWEISVPALVTVLFVSGLASMVEAAAAAFAWTVVVECFITRDIHPTRDLPRVLRHSGILVGAVLLLLASARGFSGYVVDAQIPDALVAWAQAHIHSKYVFLLVLNGALLILGSVFEIFAAIVVLAPIVAPLGAAFGVNPVHLGVVFLANMELGFLLPPAGLNLFLSASRFKVPLPRLYKEIIPFLVILAVGVLLITYATPLTEGVLTLLHKSTSN